MKTTCNAFRLAPPPASATTLELANGILTAERRTGDERMSKLSVATTGNVTFTNAGRTMVLKPKTIRSPGPDCLVV